MVVSEINHGSTNLDFILPLCTQMENHDQDELHELTKPKKFIDFVKDCGHLFKNRGRCFYYQNHHIKRTFVTRRLYQVLGDRVAFEIKPLPDHHHFPLRHEQLQILDPIRKPAHILLHFHQPARLLLLLLALPPESTTKKQPFTFSNRVHSFREHFLSLNDCGLRLNVLFVFHYFGHFQLRGDSSR